MREEKPGDGPCPSERALRQSLEDMRTLLESAQDALWSVDTEYRIVVANRFFKESFERAFDIELREGRSVMELLGARYPELAHYWKGIYDRALRGEHVTEEQDYVIEGQRRYYVVSLYPLIRDGVCIGASCYSKEVTEHRRLEEQLRQSAKMEAIGQLAGGVAHDFNNILTVIIGSCELLLRSPQVPSAPRALVEQIHRSARRASSLTSQLLAFGRKQTLRPVVLDVNAAVAETAEMLQRLIGEDIEVEAELSQGVGRVKVDRTQLEQLLLNLAINARDAMPQGGRLSLRTHMADAYAVLEVSDTGTGMTPEVREHIFEPFFTTKEPGKGTGLGLSSVYGIVQQSGGHIEVESTPGQGSTFRVYLPRAELSRPEAQAEQAPGASLH